MKRDYLEWALYYGIGWITFLAVISYLTAWAVAPGSPMNPLGTDRPPMLPMLQIMPAVIMAGIAGFIGYPLFLLCVSLAGLRHKWKVLQVELEQEEQAYREAQKRLNEASIS